MQTVRAVQKGLLVWPQSINATQIEPSAFRTSGKSSFCMAAARTAAWVESEAMINELTKVGISRTDPTVLFRISARRFLGGARVPLRCHRGTEGHQSAFAELSGD